MQTHAEKGREQQKRNCNSLAMGVSTCLAIARQL